ncbi:MAG: SDR family NAD(P)-dependent oxidoreductase [Verrucomicrobiota bacterium]
MGKVVWITGCTRGLGRAWAEGLAARGWTVAGGGRGSSQLAELQGAFSAPHFFGALDVSQEASALAWVQEALERTGAPDLLLNNAALLNQPAPLWKVSEAEFSQVIDVNLKGVQRMIRLVVPSLIARGHGVVVNLSSGWGRSTSPEVAPYCATKFAIEGLSQALAQELPPGLASIALNPGVIDTDMLRSAWGEGAASYPSTEEWAKVAVPFVETLSASENGQSLTVS